MFAGLLWKAIDKQDIQINIQIEEMHGTRYVRKGPEIPRPPNTPVSPNLHVFTNLEVLQTQSLRIFIEASHIGMID